MENSWDLPVDFLTRAEMENSWDLPVNFLTLWKKKEDPEEEDPEVEDPEVEESIKQLEELWEEDNYRKQAATSDQVYNRRRVTRMAWKPAEKGVLMDLWVVIFERNMDAVEASYAKKLMLEEAGAMLRGMDAMLRDFFRHSFPLYFLSRINLRSRFPNLVFEDITHILAMEYTDEGVPRYVLEGSCSSLQVYSARISTSTRTLNVFGVVAVRDSVDPKRNLIFNRARDDCQIITEENPCLVLTGPSRAVVMNESVIIEAELKMKGPEEDTYLFAQACEININDKEITFEGLCGTSLTFEVGALFKSVEATIFIKGIGGTWPAGFHVQFAAHTENSGNEIILIQLKSDDLTSADDNIVHLRHVVSVGTSEQLVVSYRAWKGDREKMEGCLTFDPEVSGRSWGYLWVGPCIVGVLVVWSRMRPVCEEQMSHSQMQLCF